MSSYKRPRSEPVAIVGSSCRFAGGVSSPSQLWDLISKPRDLSQKVPETRFNASAFYHPDGEYHGTTNSVRGYWLEGDYSVFDAQFFNITPKEAEAIDPQQRLTLEVVYEALESAGCKLDSWSGRNVGVFAGLMTADHETLAQRDDMFASRYYATGNARSILSNRISYFFDFHGASMTIDTACSASLVALHQAVHSLRSGETEAAVVTGSNLMLAPEQFITEASLHMLSPTGRCRMWDASADGYARGEGIAALFLKPLSRAISDRDAIHALVRETGVNSDGRTQGITMPNPAAQARLIVDTYRKSGLDPESPYDRCQYFEAHGTGTPAGDPREASAISSAFFGSENTPNNSSSDEGDDGFPRSPARTPLLVGSVKTAIGHTEGAAGLAGVLKVVQSMRHRCVPPNLHLERLNPAVEPYYKTGSGLQVPTDSIPWSSKIVPEGQPLRASVNSFGFGGANAHAILESYDPSMHDTEAAAVGGDRRATSSCAGLCSHAGARRRSAGTTLRDSPSPPSPGGGRLHLPIVLSANSQSSLAAYASRLVDYLTKPGDQGVVADANQLSWTLYKHRTSFPVRATVPGPDILSNLHKLAAGTEVGTRARTHDGNLKVLGVFTGQGAQWATMGTGLLSTNTVFLGSIEELERTLESCPDPPSWSLKNELIAHTDASRLDEAEISQPLCTAVQIGLVDVLHGLGIEFSAVVGHSSGEIAAAYAAGRLSARDAMLIAHYRGLVSHLAGSRAGSKGAMMATGLSRAEASALCTTDEYRGRAGLAASNSARSTTVSGDADAIADMHAQLEAAGVFVAKLRVDTAYHSHHMLAPGREYTRQLEQLQIQALPEGRTVWIHSAASHREGDRSTEVAELQGRYWVDNMVEPVLFHEALSQALRDLDFDCAIEVGPRPHLQGPSTGTMKDLKKTLPYSGLLTHKKADSVALADFLAFMWQNFGPASFDMESFIDSSQEAELSKRRLGDLPSYQWDHGIRYHRESRVSRQYHHRQDAVHELLGTRTRDDTPRQLRWRNYLKLDRLAWVEGHKFQGMALLPASAYCVMALDAARVVAGDLVVSVIELQNLDFSAGIALERDAHGVEILFSLSIIPSSDTSRIDAVITVESGPGSGDTQLKQNFSGGLSIILDTPSADVLPCRPATFPETLPANVDTFYEAMLDIGLQYTGPFKALEAIDRRFDFASARLKRVHPEDTTKLDLSPATLDTCFQTVFSAFSSPGDGSIWTSFLPIRIEKLCFNLAALSIETPSEGLVVDSHITNFQPTTRSAQAQIEADVLVYGESGNMEIEVAGLRVGSFAVPSPDQDYELYLHTQLAVDPEDEVTRVLDFASKVPDALIESGLRVAEFYLRGSSTAITFGHLKDVLGSPHPHSMPQVSRVKESAPRRLWPDDTEASLESFIASSPNFPTLSFIRDLGKNLPDILPGMLPTVLTEATQLGQFQVEIEHAVRQMCHRYPRMNVLGLTDPDHCITASIVGGLGRSLASLHLGSQPENNLEHLLPASHGLRSKIRVQEIDLDRDHDGETHGVYDLAVVSTTVLDKPQRLKRIRQSMRPGGFMLLCHVNRMPLKNRIRRFAGISNHQAEPLTPPDWPDTLDACGFVAVGNGSGLHDHSVTGFSLIVRQVESEAKVALSKPLELAGRVADELVVVGGHTDAISPMRQELRVLLSPHVGSIHHVSSLDKMDLALLADIPALLVLEDLEIPLMATMTAERLELFRTMFKPKTVILWLTFNGRHNPDHAATFGFARSILAEIPSLSLQMLDVDTLDCANAVAETFLRLAMRPISLDQDTDILWSVEREVYLQNGKRLIPRVLPYKAGNDSVNSVRRVVAQDVHTLENVVNLAPRGQGKVQAQLVEQIPPPSHMRRVAVEYSSVNPMVLGKGISIHHIVGRDVSSGQQVFTWSREHSSFVNVSPEVVFDLSGVPGPSRWLDLMLRSLVATRIGQDIRDKTLVLIEPDEAFVQVLKFADATPARNLRIYCTTQAKAGSGTTFLHPHASARDLKRIFSADRGHVVSFLPSDHRLSDSLQSNIPSGWTYETADNLLAMPPQAASNNSGRSSLISSWDAAISTATALCKNRSSPTNVPSLISVPEFLNNTPSPSFPFRLLDWRAERQVPCTTAPLPESHLFSPGKTYVLVGLTRDLGQSLCNLFASHGARHLVIASRSPNPSLLWVQDLRSRGVDILVERLDVASLASVRAFKDRLEADLGLPQVGGIVNGAMVLDDRVFAQMDLDAWERVLLPKTVGSKNLDATFDGPELDFFVMTSSFAATGGHGGQSNYAAANMYMNGLAASRRRRGLPGSAINIGVIYGLGLLHRDNRKGVYDSLEREGYPPISERDIHHMFLQAVVSGRPPSSAFPGVRTGAGVDLTCGLSRYDPDNVRLHWHRDPRFGHFALSSPAASSDPSSSSSSSGNDDDGGGGGEADLPRVLDVLREAKSPEEAGVELFGRLRRHIHRIVRIPEESVTREHSIAELGVDSLAAVEVRGWIWRNLQADVPVMKVLGGQTMGKLCREIVDEVLKQPAEAVDDEAASGEA
ncbi:uncharacterized protein MKZ38_008263 [Zalerion maritima]|uniref:Uncharacterized protein n=1 Tax=Zalerion maritima TaxID=339359 RepID=A0AAD5RUD4_9PEZI|nr:uncharacterized protein MKZ38_008263 [Zalerion maritima]